MTDRYESRATTHAHGCWSWGPGHYECAVGQVKRLAEVLAKILENEASDRKAAEEFGGYVLDDDLRKEARDALAASMPWRS